MDIDQTGSTVFPGGLDTTIVPFGGRGTLLFQGEAVAAEHSREFATRLARTHEYVTSDAGRQVYEKVDALLLVLADQLNDRLAVRDTADVDHDPAVSTT